MIFTHLHGNNQCNESKGLVIESTFTFGKDWFFMWVLFSSKVFLARSPQFDKGARSDLCKTDIYFLSSVFSSVSSFIAIRQDPPSSI